MHFWEHIGAFLNTFVCLQLFNCCVLYCRLSGVFLADEDQQDMGAMKRLNTLFTSFRGKVNKDSEEMLFKYCLIIFTNTYLATLAPFTFRNLVESYSFIFF